MYVLLIVGCLECDADTKIVGVFEHGVDALSAYDRVPKPDDKMHDVQLHCWKREAADGSFNARAGFLGPSELIVSYWGGSMGERAGEVRKDLL